METQATEPAAKPPPLRAFLSFAAEDKALASAFRNRIEQLHPDLELLDHAADENYEKNWKPHCAKKIDQSSVVICLVGASTHRSQAVAWEIDRGLSLGKHVVAVNLTRRAVPVPEILTRNAIEPLPSSVRSLLPSVAELGLAGGTNNRS